MRIARKLLLLALSLMAMMALGASSAMAAEVKVEATSVHCTAIAETNTSTPQENEISGGCPLQGSSSHMELGGPFGVMIECPVFMEGKVNEAGHAMAAIFEVGGNDRVDILPPNAGGSTTCMTNWAVPCDITRDNVAAGEVHPELAIIQTETASTKWMVEGNFCVRTFLGTIVDCHLTGVVNELADHNYNLVFSGNTGSHLGALCETPAGGYSLKGTLNLGPFTAPHDKIEISG